MTRWQLTSWLIVAWTGLCALWLLVAAWDELQFALDPFFSLEAKARIITNWLSAHPYILQLWFLGFVVLALVWLMRDRVRRRE